MLGNDKFFNNLSLLSTKILETNNEKISALMVVYKFNMF